MESLWGAVAGVVGIEGGVVSGGSTSNHPALARRTGDHMWTPPWQGLS
jgi:hypothetical protein